MVPGCSPQLFAGDGRVLIHRAYTMLHSCGLLFCGACELHHTLACAHTVPSGCRSLAGDLKMPCMAVLCAPSSGWTMVDNDLILFAYFLDVTWEAPATGQRHRFLLSSYPCQPPSKK